MKKSYTSYSANILKVTVATNCPQGGDAGHGGETTVEIEDKGGTSMAGSVTDVFLGEKGCDEAFAVSIVVRGDTECKTLIECLRFAADELERQHDENAERQGLPTLAQERIAHDEAVAGGQAS